MPDRLMPAITDLLVQTQSCYACIYDEESPANMPQFLHRVLQEIDEHLDANAMDRSLALFHLNDRLIDCARKGDLLSWTFLFDGVFRVSVEIQSPVQCKENASVEIENLASLPLTSDLVCPSGRLVITCLSRVGEPQACAVDVGPGIHRVYFTSNRDEEERHSFLEKVTDYPRGEGPDWKLAIRRIPAPHGAS